jgi:ATP-binding cassette subfamily B protein
MNPLLKLLPFTRGVRAVMLFTLLLSLVSQGVQVLVPFLAGQMVKQTIELHRVAELPRLTLWIMGLFALRGALNWLEIYLGSRTGQAVACRLRETVYTHLLQLRFSFFDRTRTGQLLSRLTSDLEPVNGFVRWGLRLAFRNVALLIFSLVMALRIDPTLAVIGLGSMPFIALTAWAVGNRIRPAFERSREQLGVVTSRLQDNLQGIRVVKTYVQEEREIERFTSESDGLRDLSFQAARIDAIYYPLTGFWSGMAMLLALYAGGTRVIAGTLAFDEYVTFSLLVMQLIVPMRFLGYMISVGQRAAAACERIFAILEDRRDIEPLASLADGAGTPRRGPRGDRREQAAARGTPRERRRGEGRGPRLALRGDVTFEDVHFAYGQATPSSGVEPLLGERPEGETGRRGDGARRQKSRRFAPSPRRPLAPSGLARGARGDGAEVLRGIDLEVRAGEVVGIVGTTGSGKSTLMSLIPAFYHPTRGRVLVDGHDVTRLEPEGLRRQIGFVFQDPFLFPGTLRENLLLGRPDATEEEMIAAARDAAIHDFIQTLEKGYDTVIGERGLTLSGGQQQRMTIARTILTDPKILILDDYTSSVDTYTEYLIQTALARLMRGRTTFIITPRAAPLLEASRVVVMDEGRIVCQGPPEELARTPGNLFHQLLELQGSQQLAGAR